MNEWIPHIGKSLARKLKSSEQGGELVDQTVAKAVSWTGEFSPSGSKSGGTGELQGRFPYDLRTKPVCP